MLTQFAKRVRAFRKAEEITQGDLAALTGMRGPYLADIERGGNIPTLTTLANIAAPLGLAMSDLMWRLHRRYGLARGPGEAQSAGWMRPAGGPQRP